MNKPRRHFQDHEKVAILNRFSSSPQALGYSEERQLDRAKAWAKLTGNALDESSQMVDRGLSGYHGMHRKRGHLGRFLEKVKAGEIPMGSTLVIEKVSRLSREGVYKALKNSVWALLEHGITLQFLEPELAFDRQSIDGPLLHVLIALLQTAYQESKDKSYYARQTWERKQKQARQKRILTAQCPNWLQVVDGKFQVIAEAAQSIRMLFDWKIAGLGMGTIERKLTLEAPWTPPKKPNGWRISYLKKILCNPAVIGVYQPFVREEVPVNPKVANGELKVVRKPAGEPIPDYYPAIIDAGIFHKVQKLLKANPAKPGRTSKTRNLFSFLARCAYCGGPMKYTDKGRKGEQWLVCDNAQRSRGCSRQHRIHYQEVEDTVLTNCLNLRADQVLPNPDQQARAAQALRQRLASLEGTLASIAQKRDNYMQHLGDTRNPSMRQRYEAEIDKLDRDEREQEGQTLAVQTELDRVESSLTSIEKWQRDMDSLHRNLDNVEVRQRLQMHLRELIEKVEIFAVGQPDDLEDFYAEDDSFPDFVPDQEFDRFVTFLENARNSREGRFLRVHFKTGTVAQLVPEGSIAHGMELEDAMQWKDKPPLLSQLWKHFKKRRRGRKALLLHG